MTAGRTNRTMTIVAGKDSKRSQLIDATRSLAATVRNHPSVTDAQLVALGLRPKTKVRRIIPTPSDSPIVKLKAIDGRRIAVRLTDTNRPTSRARPRDVALATIFTSIGGHEPSDASAWRWAASSSKTTIELTMNESAAPGTRVWVTACWQNRKADQGPLSAPVSVRLNFEGVEFPTILAA